MKQFYDIERSDSDDSNDGSMTEAQLEMYYKQAKEHMGKLKQTN